MSSLIEIEKNFQVYVGIDFGTDGTGLAYALPTGEVFVHQKYAYFPCLHIKHFFIMNDQMEGL